MPAVPAMSVNLAAPMAPTGAGELQCLATFYMAIRKEVITMT